MQSDGARSFGSRLLMAFFVAFLVSSYQNCGQNTAVHLAELQGSPDQRAITAQVSTSTEGSLKSTNQCQAANLHCIRKVYSPQEDDRQAAEVLCTESSGHCFDVSTAYYNTTFALQECENCGPEAARPGGEYNREEVTCWVGKPGSSEASVYALRSDFESAVHAALASCGGSLL